MVELNNPGIQALSAHEVNGKAVQQEDSDRQPLLYAIEGQEVDINPRGRLHARFAER
jgi:hypothetical protein